MLTQLNYHSTTAGGYDPITQVTLTLTRPIHFDKYYRDKGLFENVIDDLISSFCFI